MDVRIGLCCASNLKDAGLEPAMGKEVRKGGRNKTGIPLAPTNSLCKDHANLRILM